MSATWRVSAADNSIKMNLNAKTQRSEGAKILGDGFYLVSRDFAPLSLCVKNQD
jgi:hypothetical protein